MFEGMLANGFAPGGQLTTTTDVENVRLYANGQITLADCLTSVPRFPRWYPRP